MKQGQITLGLILIVLIGVAIYFGSGIQLGVLSSTFTWNGMSFTSSEQVLCSQNEYSQSGSNQEIDDLDIIHLKTSTSGGNIKREIKTDISDWDEAMVLYEGYARGYDDSSYGGDGCGSIYSKVIGSEGGEVTLSEIQCADRNSNTFSKDRTIPFNAWKFRNNFDGTWTSLQVVSIGSDITKPIEKGVIKGKAYLVLGSQSTGQGCNIKRSGGNAELKLVNIIRKENQFALCKADESYIDGQCKQIKSIVLESEEALRESFEEKLIRLEKQQEAKVQGLEEEIASLKKQNQDTEELERQLEQSRSTLTNDISNLEEQIKLLRESTNSITEIQNEIARLEERSLSNTEKQYIETIALKQELSEAKSRLADIEAKDSAVVNVIENDEIFIEPSKPKSFFNKIIAFIKSLFS